MTGGRLTYCLVVSRLLLTLVFVLSASSARAQNDDYDPYAEPLPAPKPYNPPPSDYQYDDDTGDYYDTNDNDDDYVYEPPHYLPHGSYAIDADLDDEVSKLPWCDEASEYRIHIADSHLCKLEDAALDRCPGFKAACARPFVGRLTPLQARGGGEGSGEAKKKEEREPTRLELPKAMSGFAQVLFWMLVIAGVVVLIVVIARNLSRSQKEKEGAEALQLEDEEELAAAPKGPVETDVERLLNRARAEADRGEFGKAMDDVYAALLRHLDGNGLIDIHHSSTNGDYVRSLRQQPDLQRPVKECARQVERVQFGTEAPSASGYRSLLERVLPVVTRGGMLLLLVAACVGLPLNLGACDMQQEEQNQYGDLGDDSPGGMSVFVSLLEERGIDVEHRKRGLAELDETTQVILVHGPAQLDGESWDQLLLWARKGGTLIVANHRGRPSEKLGARRTAGECKNLRVPARLSAYAGKLVVAPDDRRMEFEEDVEGTPGARSLLECDLGPYAVERRLSSPDGLTSGTLIVLPDSDMFSNASMFAANNGEVVLNLFIGSPDKLEIVDRYTVIGETSPLAAVAKGQLLPLVLQLFLLAGAFFLWRGAHFSKPRDPPEANRRAFEEHVRALGGQYAKAHASRLVLSNYAAWALERLRERVLAGRKSGLIDLAAALASRTGRSEGEVMEILVECEAARESSAGPGDAARDLRLMRELERLLAETGGTR